MRRQTDYKPNRIEVSKSWQAGATVLGVFEDTLTDVVTLADNESDAVQVLSKGQEEN